MRRIVSLVIPVVIAVGCGGTDVQQQSGPPAFQVHLPAGLQLITNPQSGEKSVSGAILVTRKTSAGEGPVANALVKINDTVIPESAVAGEYDLTDANLTIAPNDVVLLTASQANDAASVTFQCPPDVTLNAPTDQGNTQHGAALTLAWTGRTAYSSGSFAPSARLRPWNAGTNTLEAPYPALSVTPQGTQASQTFTVPNDAKTGYAAELLVPGMFADQTSSGGTAICVLVRRARLNVQ